MIDLSLNIRNNSLCVQQRSEIRFFSSVSSELRVFFFFECFLFRYRLKLPNQGFQLVCDEFGTSCFTCKWFLVFLGREEGVGVNFEADQGKFFLKNSLYP